MSKFWDILLYVAVPLAWGVAADLLIESVRRWRARRAERSDRPCEGGR